jgi:hypothetical protein
MASLCALGDRRRSGGRGNRQSAAAECASVLQPLRCVAATRLDERRQTTRVVETKRAQQPESLNHFDASRRIGLTMIRRILV